MSQSKNSLKELSIDSIEKLRDFYRGEWPKYIIAYNFLDSMFERFKNYPQQKELFKILTLNGEVNDDATFIGIMFDKELLIATLDPTFEELRNALHLLDFSIHRRFMCTKQIYRELVLDLRNELKVSREIVTIMMYMPKEEALKFKIDLPEGFELRSLSVEDAPKVHENWPHKANVTVDRIAFYIKFNPSVGLYNAEGELLSCCLTRDYKLLLNLFTDKNHLRKGYGEIVTKAISKKLAEIGYDVTASPIDNNFQSLNLFKKLGFRDIDKNHWIG